MHTVRKYFIDMNIDLIQSKTDCVHCYVTRHLFAVSHKQTQYLRTDYTNRIIRNNNGVNVLSFNIFNKNKRIAYLDVWFFFFLFAAPNPNYFTKNLLSNEP